MIAAKWSKFQRWSKPASSATCQMARSSAMSVSCCESLRPMRTGSMRASLALVRQPRLGRRSEA